MMLLSIRRLRPPPPWARSDSAACRPQRRYCAGGGRGHAGLDQRLSLSCSESTDLASVLGFNFTNVLAPAEGLRPRSRSSCTVFGFCYLLVWGYIADLSMVPRLRRGRLASRALRTPFISCAVKTGIRCPKSCVDVRNVRHRGPVELGANELNLLEITLCHARVAQVAR